MGINIAIDGTAGSGKGSVSKRVAKELGFYCLDTGAMFRSIAYKCLKDNIDINDEKAICKLIKKIDFSIIFEKDKDGNQKQKNILDGEDLGEKIRTEKMSKLSSVISQYVCVRNYTKKLQLIIAKNYDIVIEGRDIGTVILPKAKFKFFITASPEVRAERRLNQLSLPQSEYEKVLKDIKDRDKKDTEREISPLKIANDALYIDATKLTIDEVVNCIIDKIKIN